jgi:hypothetical protein
MLRNPPVQCGAWIYQNLIGAIRHHCPIADDHMMVRIPRATEQRAATMTILLFGYRRGFRRSPVSDQTYR